MWSRGLLLDIMATPWPPCRKVSIVCNDIPSSPLDALQMSDRRDNISFDANMAFVPELVLAKRSLTRGSFYMSGTVPLAPIAVSCINLSRHALGIFGGCRSFVLMR